VADDRKSGPGRQPGEHSSMHSIIQVAVAEAVRTVLEDSDSNAHRAQVDCRGELKKLSEMMQEGFQSVNDRFDSVGKQMVEVTAALASGNTRFAVM
jgi:hypothetical protein